MFDKPDVTIAPAPTVASFRPPQPPPPLAAMVFPLGWLLDHAAAPIKYRAAVEVARLSAGPSTALSHLPYSFAPAIRLAVMQSAEGIWNNSMLTVLPQRGDDFEHIGTMHAIRRLIEYGWDKESPPVYHARRILFRLLAEDNDPSLLFELTPPEGKSRSRHGRGLPAAPPRGGGGNTRAGGLRIRSAPPRCGEPDPRKDLRFSAFATRRKAVDSRGQPAGVGG